MQRHWVAVVPPERYAAERAYAFDALDLPAAPEVGPADGDRVALVAGTRPPVLFGLGVAAEGGRRARYTHRLFDGPLVVEPAYPPGLTGVAPGEFEALERGTPATSDRTEWFVSVALPIEAVSRAEAVREFWTYVDKLGPGELPAFVWPRGDELAMQAYLLGERVNLDPEEDE